MHKKNVAAEFSDAATNHGLYGDGLNHQGWISRFLRRLYQRWEIHTLRSKLSFLL